MKSSPSFSWKARKAQSFHVIFTDCSFARHISVDDCVVASWANTLADRADEGGEEKTLLKVHVVGRAFTLASSFILLLFPILLAPQANGQVLGPMQQYTLGGPPLAGPSRVLVADVNGDGKPDLVAVTNGTLTTQGTLNILLGNGDGTFKYVVSYSTGGYGTIGLAVADVNRDGNLDVVVVNAAVATNGTQGP